MTALALCLLLIVTTGIICLLFIIDQHKRGGMSSRALVPLCMFGTISFVVQVWFLLSMSKGAVLNAYVCTLLAMLCCALLLVGCYKKVFSGSATAQALLWGIFVFPTVLLIVLLISLLPDGLDTVLRALGLDIIFTALGRNT